jgi:hypothetical protein
MSKKNYLILGVGGHGWESLQDFISKCEDNLTLYTTTVDWGGFTGAFGRILEKNNEELNKKLHKDIVPILPWGDLNKILIYFFNRKFQEDTEKTLDFRSFVLLEHLNTFKIIINYLSLNQEIVVEFENYLKIFFDSINNSQSLLSLFSRPPSLGGFWQNFVYWKTGGIDGWNNFYHQKGILPKNINLLFTSNQREVLVGENEFGDKLVGEDDIDIQVAPVLPQSLHLLDKSKDEIVENQRLLTDLENADLIIIPNGSIANWLPLVNQSKVQSILQKKSENKQICWLLNLFHTQNEMEITNYIKYIHSLEIKPIILAPRELPEKPPMEMLARYQEEGKYLNLDSYGDVQKLKNLSSDLHFSLEYDLSESFKYDPLSVGSAIRKIYA